MNTNQTPSVADRGSELTDELGPLPEPHIRGCDDNETPTGYYTAEQMSAERQRCYWVGAAATHRCGASHVCDCQEAGQPCARRTCKTC